MNARRTALLAALAAPLIAPRARGNAAKPAGLECRDGEDSGPSIVEVKQKVDELLKLVSDERAANETRIAALEKRGAADPLITEEMKKIDAAIKEVRTQMDAMEVRVKRAGAAKEGADELPGADPEYRAEFHRYLRRGDIGQKIEKRAMSVGDNTEGGYLTNVELDREIAKLSRNISPARQIFAVRTIGGTAFKKPISKSNSTSGWVGELEGRPSTTTADLAEISIPLHEIYAMPGASQSILDDAYVNLEEFIAQEAVEAFDDAESTAFFTGSGTNKPFGLLSLTTTVETATGAARAAQGRLGVLQTGSATGFGTGFDIFIQLVSRLRAKYRQNARWLYSALTEGSIRTVKDSTGQYLWQPSNQLGVAATFLGYPTTVCDHMPDIADNALPVAFGDFQRAYQIVDRVGVRTLRDPFSAKPYVLFYMTKRVGGGHLVTEAFKAIQTH